MIALKTTSTVSLTVMAASSTQSLYYRKKKKHDSKGSHTQSPKTPKLPLNP